MRWRGRAAAKRWFRSAAAAGDMGRPFSTRARAAQAVSRDAASAPLGCLAGGGVRDLFGADVCADQPAAAGQAVLEPVDRSGASVAAGDVQTQAGEGGPAEHAQQQTVGCFLQDPVPAEPVDVTDLHPRLPLIVLTPRPHWPGRAGRAGRVAGQPRSRAALTGAAGASSRRRPSSPAGDRISLCRRLDGPPRLLRGLSPSCWWCWCWCGALPSCDGRRFV